MCFFVCVFSSFRAFLGSFLALGAWRRAAPFSVGLFVCVFVCVFSSFRAFLGSFLALGAGRRAALFSVGLFVCVFVCVFSSFRAFLGSFLALVCVFYSFRAFLGSFLALGAGRRAAPFSVGLFVCVFVCVFSSFRAFLDSFSGCWAPCCSFFRRAFCVRFCLCFLFFSGFFGFLATTEREEGQRLMTADWGLITAAGEASDSGRGADYKGGKGL